jgi:hypothetical protein
MSPENAKLLSNLAVVDALLGKKQDAVGEARHAVEMRAASKDALAGPGIRGLLRLWLSRLWRQRIDHLQGLRVVPVLPSAGARPLNVCRPSFRT